MQTQKTLNTFQKGMQQDYDNLQVSKQSYLESRGGRVVFNQDGTYAWQPANGTAISFTILANYTSAIPDNSYKPIGGVEIQSLPTTSLSGYVRGNIIIFSTNGTNSEIGSVFQDAYLNWNYQTLFNDLYDYWGDKLNFSVNNPMRDMQVDVENNVTARVEFNDWNNEPRTFNILLGLNNPDFANGAYMPVQSLGFKYPPYYSVHGMSDMPDLTWGLIKYQQQISGQLLSGQYQYAYRYIHQTGYASVWSPLSQFVFLTSDTANNNWAEYQMLASGLQTTKGNQVEFKYLDTRYQQIEVAAIYWETPAAPTSATSFAKVNIPTNGDVVIQHQQAGASLAVEIFDQIYTEFSKAKTGGQKDNTYHLANYSIYPQEQLTPTQLAAITAVPFTRPMRSDTTTTGVVATPPLTNAGTPTDSVTVSTPYGGETYDIVADYINYKGTQWNALFPGYFGGEIYGFALQLFDRKGQPFFTQHISDITFPQRYTNTYNDNRLSGPTNQAVPGTSPGDFSHTNNANVPFTDSLSNTNGLWYLNLMGMKFGNIDLTDILFDANGKLQVSGFAIVRIPRQPQRAGIGYGGRKSTSGRECDIGATEYV